MVDRLGDLGGSSDSENDIEMGTMSETTESTIVESDDDEQELEEFFKDIEQIKQWLETIKEEMGRIHTSYTKLLTSTETKKTNEIRRNLATSRDNVQGTADQVRQALKTIQKENDQFLSVRGTTDPSLCKIRTNTHGSLVRKFLDLMQEYQELLGRHDKKIRTNAHHQVAVVAPNATEEEIDEALDKGEDIMDAVFAQNIMQDRKNKEAQQTLDFLTEKHNDILEIEKSITELRQLFVDMQTLVEAQGDLIDQIEFSVEKGKAYQVKTDRVLVGTAGIVKSTRKKKIIFAVTIVLILIVIVIIILIIAGVIGGISAITGD